MHFPLNHSRTLVDIVLIVCFRLFEMLAFWIVFFSIKLFGRQLAAYFLFKTFEPNKKTNFENITKMVRKFIDFLYLTMVLTFSFLFFLFYPVFAEDPCQVIQREQIIAIGELEKSIMLITKNYRVFCVNKDALREENNTRHVFHFKGAISKQLDELFPAFKSNKDFQANQYNFYHGRIHEIEDSATITLEINGFNKSRKSLTYDMKKQEFVDPDKFEFMEVEGSTVSKDDRDVFMFIPKFFTPLFYVLSTIDHYAMRSRAKEITLERTMGVRAHSFEPDNGNFVEKFSNLIVFDNKSMHMALQVSVPQEGEWRDWSNMNGFVINGFVYLFDLGFFTTFKEEFFTIIKINSTKPREYEHSNGTIQAFFSCSGPEVTNQFGMCF